MKKWMSAAISIVFLLGGAGMALAAQRGTPEYEKLKEYKKAQREKEAQPSANAKGFWQKEAERSGFAGTAAMFGNALGSAIPLDKPNSRKTK